MKQRRSAAEIWRMPALLGVLTVVGLLAGLFGDGISDVLSWLALAVPAAMCVWAVWFRSPSDNNR